LDNGSSKLPGAIFNPVANPVALNSEGNTSIGAGIINFDGGNHSISASYAGDNSFDASSSTQPVTFTIQPGFTGVSGLANITVASPGGSGTTTLGVVASTGFTTAISITCSGAPAGVTCSPSPITLAGPNKVVTSTITVTTTAATAAMLQRNGRHYYFATMLFGALPLASIFVVVVAAPRRRRWSLLLGLLVFAFLIGLPGCGGGSSSHTPPPPPAVTPTPAGTYTINLTATAGSTSQQEGSFTLTVQ
jgi:hypothetical protein